MVISPIPQVRWLSLKRSIHDSGQPLPAQAPRPSGCLCSFSTGAHGIVHYAWGQCGELEFMTTTEPEVYGTLSCLFISLYPECEFLVVGRSLQGLCSDRSAQEAGGTQL